MESAVMVDSERKEELVLAKNLRACSTPFRAQRLSPKFLEAVPFVKKEPLYVTMRSKENDWIEDSLRIKEAKNVAGHNLDPNIRDGLCNNSNATHRIQSPIRKESNYA